MDYALVGPLDNRIQVIASRVFPYNTLCHLGRDFGVGIRWGCSGTLISPTRLLTAAHCLYSLKLGMAPKQLWVAPGRQDRDHFPFGRKAALEAYVPRGFLKARNQSERRANDYGLVLLRQPFDGISRYMPVVAYSDAMLVRLQHQQKRLIIGGYPADRPVGTLWQHSEVLRRFSPTRLYYSVDTCPGHSGSPVWVKDQGTLSILAVHTSGILDERGRSHGCAKGTVMAPPGSLNSGVRITADILSNLRNPKHMGHDPGPMVRVL